MRTCYTILFFLLAAILPTKAQQGYQQLWAEVYRQAKADKPRNEMHILERISNKALRESNYGQRLTADLLRLSLVRQTYGDDSLAAVRRLLEQRKLEAKTTHPALAAVYACALGLKEEALADPALLARTKATALSPLLMPSAEMFGGDLLSAIAWQTGQYQKAHDYYEQTGNRPAALATDLWMAPNGSKDRIIGWCDSLLAKYGDLKESQLITATKARLLNDSAAVALADSTLRHWTGDTSGYGNQLRNIKMKAEQPILYIQLERKYFHSNEWPWLHIGYNNLERVDVAVYGMANGRQKAKPLWHTTKQLLEDEPWRQSTDSLQLPPLPYGSYKVVAKARGMKATSLYYIVSDLNVTINPESEKTVRMRVVDTRSGRPVAGAKIGIGDEKDYSMEEADNDTNMADVVADSAETDDNVDIAIVDSAEYDIDDIEVDTVAAAPSVHGVFTTNAQGEAIVPYIEEGMYVRPFTEKDHWREAEFVYLNGSEGANACHILINAYTDRALYRPGDTAHVAIVAFARRPGHRRKALARTPLQLLFYNTREYGPPMATIDVTTDDYGTAYADIPLTGKWTTGNEYTGMAEPRWKTEGAIAQVERLIGQPIGKNADDVNVDGGGLSFRIEEYKLGSLQVSLHTSPSHYMPGDTVTVSGRVFLLNGAPVAGAKVETKGDTTQTTDSKGMFTAHIAVPLDKNNSYTSHLWKAYTVTAPDGQQRTENVILSYSNKKAFLSCNNSNFYQSKPKGYCRDSLLAINCSLRDAQGNKVEGNVSWQLDDGTQGRMAANQTGFIPLKTLQAGQHELRMWAEGDTLTCSLSVIDPAAHRLSHPTFFWTAASADEFKDNGQPVVVQMGTTEKDLTLYYELRSAESLLERGSMVMADTVITRTLLYNRDAYGGGVTLSLAAYGQGKMGSYDLRLPFVDTAERLHAQWEQLGSVVEPGQRQEWRLRVIRPSGQPADAQVLVTLYDSGLDLISDNTWTNDWEMQDDLPTSYTTTIDNDGQTTYETKRLRLLTPTDIRPATFADGLISLEANARAVAYQLGGWTLGGKGKPKTGYCHGIVYDASGEVLAGAMLMTSQGKTGITDWDGTFSIPVSGTAQLTVSYIGFQPSTLTVRGGESVAISLKDDENSLQEVVALGYVAPGEKFEAPVIKKDVEVKSEDRSFSKAQVDKNLSTNRMVRRAERSAESEGRARRNFRTLALWAPATVTDRKGLASFDFTMPDNVTTWRLQGLVHDREGGVASLDTTVQSRMALMVADNLPRFLRRGDEALLPLTVSNMGDGRLKGALAVLAVDKGASLMDEKYRFSLQPSMSKTIAAPLRVPTDTLLQSITVRAKASARNHRDIMEKTIAIASDKERVAEIETIDRPASEAIREALGEMDSVRGGDALSLAAKVYTAFKLDELDDDEEESETTHDAHTPLSNLQRLQRGDGTFGWWPGMPSSRIVTVTVAEMLAPLVADHSEIEHLLQPTRTRLAAWLVEDAKQLEKVGEAGCNLEEAYHILYALSLTPAQLTAEAKAARKTLLDHAEGHGAYLTILGKARVATALHQDGRREAARSMMESLGQYAVTTADRVTYFDTPKAYYSWRDYKIPTVTAAIHALSLIAPADTALLMGMKRWLVEEKKTQKWDTPLVTADAVEAFLTGPMPQSVAWPVVKGWHEQVASALPNENKGFAVSRTIEPADSSRRDFNVGDRVRVVIKVHADRDYDFVRITDHRPACLMPVSQLSDYDWRLGCYVRPMDEQTDYYFETLPKGDYTLRTEFYIDRPGNYHAGAVKAECEYNPAFMGRENKPTSVSIGGEDALGDTR